MEKGVTLLAAGAMERIFADMKTVGPPSNVVLAYGKPAASITYLALNMAFAGVARQKPVVFLDGANSFDPFVISKIARGVNLVPEELLGRIHISRAFTCHQMEALVAQRLAGALDRFDTNVAIVSGLLNTFYDESVPFAEAYGLLKTTTAEFSRLAGRGARILLVCPDTHLPLESRQRRYLDLLRKISNKTLRSEGGKGKTRFAMEKPRKKYYSLIDTPALSQQRWR